MSEEATGMTSSKRFVLEEIDLLTECAIHEKSMYMDSVKEFAGAFDLDLDALLAGDILEIEETAGGVLAQFFERPACALKTAVQLRPWHRLDDLPYKIHTNRELILMVQGTKPFAFFTEPYPLPPDYWKFSEQLFDVYVSQGIFSKREIFVPCQPINKNGVIVDRLRTIFYALKFEEWRIDSYILLTKTAKITGWSEGLVRMEGSLLGYEDWQNDIYIKEIYVPQRESRRETETGESSA